MSKPLAKTDFIEDTYANMRSSVSGKHKTADPLALELSFNLIHTANMAQNLYSDLTQTSDLTFPGFNVLGLLSHQRDTGLPLHEIGRLLLVSRANVTGLIDSLERRGLVERVDHATDRRVYLARITKKGETILNSHRPVYFKMVADMSAGLNAAEKKTLIQLLKKWRSTIDVSRKEQ
jgi:MarR family 2-MHQ and catechol resistance regulon transcriptional repressor